MLGFQTYRAVLEMIAGVNLHARFGGADFHDPPDLGLGHPCGQHQRLAATGDDVVVVVTKRRGISQFFDSGTNSFRLTKINGTISNINDLPG